MLEGIAAQRGLELRLFDGEPDAATLPCGPGDVVVLSHVGYRTGALADLAALQAAARERGATLIWDLSHSAGAVPVDLRARRRRARRRLHVQVPQRRARARPAYLYVAPTLQERLRSPIQGWFGQRDQFAMERDYDPEPSIRRFLAGTPPILGLAAVEEGVRLTAEAGIAALHAKAIELTELMIALHDAWLAPLGFSVATPRDPARRGSHVALRHPRGLADHPRADRARRRRSPTSAARTPCGSASRRSTPGASTSTTRSTRLRDLVARGEHRAFDPAPAPGHLRPLAAVAVLGEHELLGQRRARRRRRVGDDRDRLGHRAADLARAAVERDDHVLVVVLGQRALQAGLDARSP